MTPARTSLRLALLGVCALSLAATLDPWASSTYLAARNGGLLQMLLGDGKRLFANQCFAMADAYFHKGVYPSIFDPPRHEEMHLATEGHSAAAEQGGDEGEDHDGDHDHDHEHDHGHEASEPSAPPADWIARLNNHFTPSAHAHLGGGDAREMLPWLKLSAELDPSNVLNFTVTAYWLRTGLKRLDEAEQFLREGLRHNPDSPEILFELGVLHLEGREDPAGAEHLLEQALRRWEAKGAEHTDAERALGAAILIRLARIAESTGRRDIAIRRLEQLRPMTPNTAPIDEQIRQLQAAGTNAAPATPPAP